MPLTHPSSVRDGIAIGVTTGVIGVVYGVLARGAGLGLVQTCAMSLIMFTGASQFTLVSLVRAGAGPWSMLIPTVLLSARNALYGPVVRRFFDHSLRGSTPIGLAAAQLMIDESTGVGAAQDTQPARRVGFWAGGIGVYVFWNLGTLLGATIGASVNPDALGLDAAFPASFIALVLPHLRTQPGRAAALIGAIASMVSIPLVPSGAPIVVGFIGAPLAALLVKSPAEEQ